ncbi:hypothetical protein ACGFZS_09950 [Streptomyces sp. NPDC048288]|uniref:hypothetical protein n=1 Tax=Streptomyces sp. NPDC048288 TaxID=3365529 RepID=UPI003724C0EE
MGTGQGDQPALLPDDIAAYELVAHGGDPGGLPVERLLDGEFIAPDPQHPGRYLPLDPRVAAQRIVARERAALSQAATRLAELPDLTDQLAAHFDPHRYYGGPGSEFLADKAAMNTRIGQVVGEASSELYTAQPGQPETRDPAVVRLGIQRSQTVLARGVQMRTLYPAGADAHAPTRDYVEQITAAGAGVRLLSGPFPRLVLVDGRHLFIDNHVIDGEGDAGWHVFDRSAVMWAREVFLMLWNRARCWQDAAPTTVTTGRQRRILHELTAGHSQQQVGPRVGLSDRVVAKELAAVREALGMETLYQVMAWWGASRESDLP